MNISRQLWGNEEKLSHFHNCVTVKVYFKQAAQPKANLSDMETHKTKVI